MVRGGSESGCGVVPFQVIIIRVSNVLDDDFVVVYVRFVVLVDVEGSWQRDWLSGFRVFIRLPVEVKCDILLVLRLVGEVLAKTVLIWVGLS